MPSIGAPSKPDVPAAETDETNILDMSDVFPSRRESDAVNCSAEIPCFTPNTTPNLFPPTRSPYNHAVKSCSKRNEIFAAADGKNAVKNCSELTGTPASVTKERSFTVPTSMLSRADTADKAVLKSPNAIIVSGILSDFAVLGISDEWLSGDGVDAAGVGSSESAGLGENAGTAGTAGPEFNEFTR